MEIQEQWPLNRKCLTTFFFLLLFDSFFCVKLAPGSSCLLHAFIVLFLCIYQNKPHTNHTHQIPFNRFSLFSILLYNFMHSLKRNCPYFCVFFILHSFFIIFFRWRIWTIEWHMYLDAGFRQNWRLYFRR